MASNDTGAAAPVTAILRRGQAERLLPQDWTSVTGSGCAVRRCQADGPGSQGQGVSATRHSVPSLEGAGPRGKGGVMARCPDTSLRIEQPYANYPVATLRWRGGALPANARDECETRASGTACRGSTASFLCVRFARAGSALLSARRCIYAACLAIAQLVVTATAVAVAEEYWVAPSPAAGRSSGGSAAAPEPGYAPVKSDIPRLLIGGVTGGGQRAVAIHFLFGSEID